MGQTFKVQTEDGRDVWVTLDKVPIGLKARNTALQAEMDAGRFSETPPEPTTGQMARGLIRGAADVALPMVGAGAGAALGAPLGPPGMVGGAVLGGMAGMAGRETVDLADRVISGQPPRPTGDVMKDVLVGGARYGLESTPPGAIVGGVEKMVTGQPTMGALQIGTGLMGLPQTGAMLGQVPTIAQTIQNSVRANTTRAAQRLGIDLTAAEQSGSPFLEAAEAVLMRTGGSAHQFRTLGAAQNAQAMGAAETLVQQTTGDALQEAAVRGNRFAIDLKERLAAMKNIARAKEADFYRAVGSSSSVDMTPAVQAATSLMEELPKTPSLVSGRLKAIFQDLIDLGQNTTTLEEVRRIRTALGEFAYPSGQAIPEVPQAQAQKLYGALTQTLDDFAASRGPGALAKWQEARETTKRLHAVTDGTWYADVLDGSRSLPDFSRKLFSDIGMLRDAKVLTSDAGWKMIQQQYWDDALFHSGNLRTTPDGTMILGRQFGDRIAKDQAVLKELFGPESAAAIRDLASVLRTAEPTMSVTRNRAFTTGLVEFFQSRAIGQAVTGGANVASAATVGLLPYVLGKALTNPTTARMISSAVSKGTLGGGTAEAVVNFLIRAQATPGRKDSSEEE